MVSSHGNSQIWPGQQPTMCILRALSRDSDACIPMSQYVCLRCTQNCSSKITTDHEETRYCPYHNRSYCKTSGTRAKGMLRSKSQKCVSNRWNEGTNERNHDSPNQNRHKTLSARIHPQPLGIFQNIHKKKDDFNDDIQILWKYECDVTSDMATD